MAPPLSLRALLAAALAALASAASATPTSTVSPNTLSSTRTGTPSPSVTRSSTNTPSPTKTASATVVSPSFTPSASSFPSLTVEQWGVYDISPTSADPTQLLPVFLLRSQIDNQLYLEFVNYVEPSSNPPTSESVPIAERARSLSRSHQLPPLRHRAPDAVDVYNAWYDNGTPYSNVATQGTRNPAGDNLCVSVARVSPSQCDCEHTASDANPTLLADPTRTL